MTVDRTCLPSSQLPARAMFRSGYRYPQSVPSGSPSWPIETITVSIQMGKGRPLISSLFQMTEAIYDGWEYSTWLDNMYASSSYSSTRLSALYSYMHSTAGDGQTGQCKKNAPVVLITYCYPWNKNPLRDCCPLSRNGCWKTTWTWTYSMASTRPHISYKMVPLPQGKGRDSLVHCQVPHQASPDAYKFTLLYLNLL